MCLVSNPTPFPSFQNPSSSVPLFFKMKTTAPARYIVKPHRGTVEAGGKVDIAVTLLPFHFRRKDKKTSDKFLLQACSMSGENKLLPGSQAAICPLGKPF